MPKHPAMVPVERIERLILVFCGQKVMLFEIKALSQAVRRKIERFPFR